MWLKKGIESSHKVAVTVLTVNIVDLITIVMCFYKISHMLPDMDLEIGTVQETAHLDGSFSREIIQIFIFSNFW